jgi:hypothetical protein
MKKSVKFVIELMVLLVIMFAEYRYIMTNITPYHGDNDAVYLEIFGQVDEYYAEEWDDSTMYHIDLVGSDGNEFYSILGEFVTVEDAIGCIEQHIKGRLIKLTDNIYLDGHDVYTIYRR